MDEKTSIATDMEDLAKKLANQEIEILEDGPYDAPKQVISAYAKKLGVDLEQAEKRLKANYKAEYESIDGREMALKNTKHLRMLAPKIMGLEQREQGTMALLKKNTSAIKRLNTQLDELNKENDKIKLLVLRYENQIRGDISNLPSLMGKIKQGFNRLLCLMKLK